ncbi:TetR/AcrR family transcriptional regulator [Micromonospora sp. NPDC050495]|uniref:TetR/AcrR family transcriptional regulator n=1 Tax=Micromonospora sp. NPDC050495 TaxID=3154936 RepID=UPI003409A92D
MGTSEVTASAARRRPTHEQRSVVMRQRLLDATIASLGEKGYAGTTTLEVQQRAGVSRGALLHHYASRTELILAAVEYLLRERFVALQGLTAPPPREDRLGWAVQALWGTFGGPLFSASLELWLAARNDPELRAALLPQERLFGAASNEWAAGLFGPAASHPQFPTVLEILLDAMRGAAARAVLRSPSSDERLLTAWTQLVKSQLETDPQLPARGASANSGE